MTFDCPELTLIYSLKTFFDSKSTEINTELVRVDKVYNSFERDLTHLSRSFTFCFTTDVSQKCGES